VRFLAISKRLPGADPERIAALAVPETRAAWALYASGVVRELCFDAEARRGIVFLECEDRAAAQRALATLPLVAARQIDFDLYALGPYRQLESLFTK
jgi:hypothetical protein